MAEDKNHIGLPLFCQDCRRVFDRREGRPDEIILKGKAGLKDTAVFSIGSDETDGPTDAAGGFCDGGTEGLLRSGGIEIARVLRDNNAYMALEAADGLIKTGPTGTNVNDVAVLLIKRDSEPEER